MTGADVCVGYSHQRSLLAQTHLARPSRPLDLANLAHDLRDALVPVRFVVDAEQGEVGDAARAGLARVLALVAKLDGGAGTGGAT